MADTQHSKIADVSDTALWVAHYRAKESERPDALFKDPFAKLLSGERGREIAESMKQTSRYTEWVLAIRTPLIDRFIFELLQEGADMVVNLGAGLDARPYRLDLPPTLPWIEVDYPHMIEHKEKVLANAKPKCRLERVRLDLSDRPKRQKLFAELARRGQKIIVLTEGVIPYLTVDQVAELADDLHAHPQFHFWITDYLSKDTYRYIQSGKRAKQMKNAPFRFMPDDWFGHFKTHGWRELKVSYLGEESIRLKRKMPAPWFAFLLGLFMSKERKQRFLRFSGYIVFVRD